MASPAWTNLMRVFQNVLSRQEIAGSLVKLAALGGIAVFGYSASYFLNDYRRWKNLGPGGLPYNIIGYVLNLVFVAFIAAKADSRDLEPYKNPDRYLPGWNKYPDAEKKLTTTSFLAVPLPRRTGPQVRAKWYVVPQREKDVDAPQDPVTREAYLNAFDKLGILNEESVDWATSELEKRGSAMFLRPRFLPPLSAAKSKREIAHIHTSDLSGHVMLSFADSEEAIAKGWCERHRLSGTNILPLGYTFTYQPQTVEEVAVYIDIFQAGIDYMKSSGLGTGQDDLDVARN